MIGTERLDNVVDPWVTAVLDEVPVEDHRAAHGISEQIHAVDWTGVWWRKG